jgi:hypothetical protein
MGGSVGGGSKLHGERHYALRTRWTNAVWPRTGADHQVTPEAHRIPWLFGRYGPTAAAREIHAGTTPPSSRMPAARARVVLVALC